MRTPDILSMDATQVAFVLQPEPSRTRKDARLAAEEAVAYLQAALNAMAACPDARPVGSPPRTDGAFALDLPDGDLRIVLARHGNSYRRLRLDVELGRSSVLSCQIDSRLEKGTRAHFKAALVLFLHAARAGIDAARGDAALDDLKAVAALLQDVAPLDHLLKPPLPWHEGEIGTRSGAKNATPVPPMPFAAALTCVHDFKGVFLSVDRLSVEIDPDMDAMERLRLLRRSAVRKDAPSMLLMAA
jgi:hypothetical protein